MIVVDLSAERRRIIARRQRIAKNMRLSGEPMHRIRKALGASIKEHVIRMDEAAMARVWRLYKDQDCGVSTIERLMGFSRRKIHWLLDEARRRKC